MKRFVIALIAIAAAAILAVFAPSTFAAPPVAVELSKPAAAMNPASASCKPAQAGGLGRFFTQVYYPDEQATIFSWYCPDGSGASLVALDEWKPKLAAIKYPPTKEFATELSRLDMMEGMGSGSPKAGERLQRLKAKAAEQIRLYEPTPEQRRKLAAERTVI